MAIDAALLDGAIARQSPLPLLRLYTWEYPALSVGAHQRLSAELLARATRSGIEVVRRPSGGTAVLHGEDITYAVVAPYGRMGVLEAYRWVAGCLIAGLARLGIDARIGEGRRGTGMIDGGLGSDSACFAATVGADLQVGEMKICGSAQVRRQGWFLQHGSIPLADGREKTRSILRHPAINRSTCVDALRPGTSVAEISSCLIEGFESRWGLHREVELGQCLPNPLVIL